MKASEEGHMECVKVLVDGGADVNVQNKVNVVSYSRGHSVSDV